MPTILVSLIDGTVFMFNYNADYPERYASDNYFTDKFKSNQGILPIISKGGKDNTIALITSSGFLTYCEVIN